MTEPRYLLKAKETYRFHREKLVENATWRVQQTAKLLRRSMGSVSEDLQIARFCKNHEKELMKLKYAYEALEFMRRKQKEEDMSDL